MYREKALNICITRGRQVTAARVLVVKREWSSLFEADALYTRTGVYKGGVAEARLTSPAPKFDPQDQGVCVPRDDRLRWTRWS